MTALAYTVRATLPDARTRDDFVGWLTTGGHIAEVVAGGAEHGEVVIFDADEGEPIVVEVRYRFPSREIFDAYERDHAPRLRAEGIEKFGNSGIEFVRSVGTIADA